MFSIEMTRAQLTGLVFASGAESATFTLPNGERATLNSIEREDGSGTKFNALLSTGPNYSPNKVRAFIRIIPTEIDCLAEYARAHGHEVRVFDDCILVGIDWVDSEHGTRGRQWDSARNMGELRDILGY